MPMDWNLIQGWGAMVGLGILTIGIIFTTGKIFQDHVNTKDRIKTLEEDIISIKSRNTTIELVKQAVEELREQFSELRRDLRDFVSIELGRRKRGDDDGR